MFGRDYNLIGIDIGTESIKIVEISQKNNSYILERIGFKELPRGVISEGSIVDTAEIVNSVIELYKDSKFSNKKVASSLKGNAVIAKRISIPTVDESLLEEEFRYQAQQFITMNIDDVNLDYHLIGSNFEASTSDILLAVARKDLISNLESTLSSAGLKTIVVDLEVFALVNAFEVNYGIESDVSAIINFGHTSTFITFIKNGNYEFSREINTGGINCIEMIQHKLGITYEDAKQMIINRETVEYNEDLNNIIATFNSQISTEIKNTFDMFYSSSKINIDRIYLCGGLCTLYGLSDTLEKFTNVKNNMFNPFLNIEISPNIDRDFLNLNLYRFNVSLGLALRKGNEK